MGMSTADLAREATHAREYKREHVLELTFTDLVKHVSAIVAGDGFTLPSSRESWVEIIRLLARDPESDKFIKEKKNGEELSALLTWLHLIDGFFITKPESFDRFSVDPNVVEHQKENLKLYPTGYRNFLHRAARMVEDNFMHLRTQSG